MEEAKKQNRYFLIYHEGCGSKFTIDIQTFIKVEQSDYPPEKLVCPNCGTFIAPREKIAKFLFRYEAFTGSLKGFTIREFSPEEIDTEIIPKRTLK